jgi:hypothetical protein
MQASVVTSAVIVRPAITPGGSLRIDVLPSIQ